MLLEPSHLALAYLLSWLKRGKIGWTYMHVGGAPQQGRTLQQEADCIWQGAPFNLKTSLDTSSVTRLFRDKPEGEVLRKVMVYAIRLMPEDIIAAAKAMVNVPASSPRGGDLDAADEPDIVSITGTVTDVPPKLRAAENVEKTSEEADTAVIVGTVTGPPPREPTQEPTAGLASDSDAAKTPTKGGPKRRLKPSPEEPSARNLKGNAPVRKKRLPLSHQMILAIVRRKYRRALPSVAEIHRHISVENDAAVWKAECTSRGLKEVKPGQYHPGPPSRDTIDRTLREASMI
jgi:hypothetical protein